MTDSWGSVEELFQLSTFFSHFQFLKFPSISVFLNPFLFGSSFKPRLNWLPPWVPRSPAHRKVFGLNTQDTSVCYFWSLLLDGIPSEVKIKVLHLCITHILHEGSRRSLKVCWMNVELITIVLKSVQISSFHNNCLHGKILSSVWEFLYHFSFHDNCYLFMYFFLMKIKASWGQSQCYL